MPLALSIFFGFVPMFFFAWFVYWLDRYEKEPLPLLGGAFLWGAVVAAGGAFFINTLVGISVFLVTESESSTNLVTMSLSAPLVEESLKALAVLGIFLFFRHEFDSLLDGAVYAAVTAMGFAATENVYYIYVNGYEAEGYAGLFALAFIRIVLVGWQHPFYTAFTGLGLAAARLSRSNLVRVGAPVLGWLLAVVTHSAHNTLATFLSGLEGLLIGTTLDWIGWGFMFAFILFIIHREGKLIALQLKEEVPTGTLSQAQYDTAKSSWLQSAARLGALISGNYRRTTHFYQLCGELAHKKNQLQKIGKERDNDLTIEKLRGELAVLAPQVK